MKEKYKLTPKVGDWVRKAEENRYKDAQMKSLKLGITLKRLLIFVIVTFIILFVIRSCVYMLESGI